MIYKDKPPELVVVIIPRNLGNCEGSLYRA